MLYRPSMVEFCRADSETVWQSSGAATMSKRTEIRCYDYVNHPYNRVRDALKHDALVVFQSATKAAVSRLESVAAELHVDLGAVAVQKDIAISVKNVEEKVDAMSTPSTGLAVEWEAASRPGWFPLMKATLSIYPLTGTETQLDFWGFYEPPFGTAGKAINAVVGHRIAEASVHRFIDDVAAYLRRTLG